MFRMRAAGYRGPNIFSPGAIKLIADASNGLMRRVNILADKSLLAAFVEDTHDVEERHVQAAMRDCEIKPPRSMSDKKLLMSGAAAALLLTGLATWLMPDKQQLEGTRPMAESRLSANVPADKVAQNLPGNGGLGAPAGIKGGTELAAGGAPMVAPPALIAPPPVPTASASTVVDKSSLFEQRLAAGKQLLEQTASTSSGQAKAVASIQLFYNDEIQKGRIENFLKRANGLGKLSEIYLLPAKFGSKDGLRVLYGAYPSVDAARNAVKGLPTRYQEAFTVTVYTF
jgi:hypothetical protein